MTSNICLENPDVAKLVLDAAADPSVVIINQAVEAAKIRASCAWQPSSVLFQSWAAKPAISPSSFWRLAAYTWRAVWLLHTLPVIKEALFMQRFKRKGRFADD